MKIFNSDKSFLVIIFLIFFLSSLYAFAYGGGGGGSSSGLGFGSRDSVFILVSQDYSEKFSLKNGTKYELKINVDNDTVNVNFGDISIELEKGDNFVDLNDNGFADINFNLVKVSGIRADVRIINSKDTVVLTKEVPNAIVEKSIPEEKKELKKEIEDQEKDLKCVNLVSVKERVSCRLDLEEEELEQELKLQYLPEECRALSGSIRGLCIARYKSVQTCWKFPIGDERISCVKREIKLGDLQEEKERCNVKTGQEKALCINELKGKVYNLIKWRFYALEERAEDFMERGFVDKDLVVDFNVKIEENKRRFNEASTKKERKKIILDVRNDWKEFINIVRENLRG